MTNIVRINNHDVHQITHNGEVVTTFATIDLVHERPEGTAKAAFNRHKERMTEGKHFYRMNGAEAVTAGLVREKYEAGRYGITLVTQRGYLMLAKVFDDDLAWTVQEQMSDCYFAVKQAAPMVYDVNQALQVLVAHLAQTSVTKQELQQTLEPVVEKLDRIAEIVDAGEDFCPLALHLQKLGFKASSTTTGRIGKWLVASGAEVGPKVRLGQFMVNTYRRDELARVVPDALAAKDILRRSA